MLPGCCQYEGPVVFVKQPIALVHHTTRKLLKEPGDSCLEEEEENYFLIHHPQHKIDTGS